METRFKCYSFYSSCIVNKSLTNPLQHLDTIQPEVEIIMPFYKHQYEFQLVSLTLLACGIQCHNCKNFQPRQSVCHLNTENHVKVKIHQQCYPCQKLSKVKGLLWSNTRLGSLYSAAGMNSPGLLQSNLWSFNLYSSLECMYRLSTLYRYDELYLLLSYHIVFRLL